jgi:hypothetical protein
VVSGDKSNRKKGGARTDVCQVPKHARDRGRKEKPYARGAGYARYWKAVLEMVSIMRMKM